MIQQLQRRLTVHFANRLLNLPPDRARFWGDHVVGKQRGIDRFFVLPLDF